MMMTCRNDEQEASEARGTKIESPCWHIWISCRLQLHRARECRLGEVFGFDDDEGRQCALIMLASRLQEAGRCVLELTCWGCGGCGCVFWLGLQMQQAVRCFDEHAQKGRAQERFACIRLAHDAIPDRAERVVMIPKRSTIERRSISRPYQKHAKHR